MSLEAPLASSAEASARGVAHRRRSLSERYREVRRTTEQLAAPLSPEDCVVQSMPDASPAKWHLAHTTWYFETFVLRHAAPDYRPFHPRYGYLFNSYYNAVGDRHPRPLRGLLTRPALDEVYAYRRAVDERMADLLERPHADAHLDIVELGLHHEQQHQELLLTDVKHLLACNPLRPAYAESADGPAPPAPSLRWIEYAEGLRSVGHAGREFAFDNESPRHRVFLEAFALASRLVTAGEYLEFIADDGYRRPEFWLSEGWDSVRMLGWESPLYWERDGAHWLHDTLSGARPVREADPVCHVSFYEADAYARWRGCRLPTEFEWEAAAAECPVQGNFLEAGLLRPAPAVEDTNAPPVRQLFGDVWEWTSSAYAPYPGYAPPAGALGEYNGKFMCNQMVLRGGSCATPRSHVRATYRNFFKPEARWQFMGIRLAKSL